MTGSPRTPCVTALVLAQVPPLRCPQPAQLAEGPEILVAARGFLRFDDVVERRDHDLESCDESGFGIADEHVVSTRAVDDQQDIERPGVGHELPHASRAQMRARQHEAIELGRCTIGAQVGAFGVRVEHRVEVFERVGEPIEVLDVVGGNRVGVPCRSGEAVRDRSQSADDDVLDAVLLHDREEPNGIERFPLRRPGHVLSASSKAVKRCSSRSRCSNVS